MRILKLDQANSCEAFFEDARILGIVARVKDYHFCLQLNRAFRFDFRVSRQMEIHTVRKQRKYFYEVYEYGEPRTSLWHFIYNNQCNGEFLLPELRHLDYVWLMRGDEISDQMVGSLLATARQIPCIQLITELSMEAVRSRENLMF